MVAAVVGLVDILNAKDAKFREVDGLSLRGTLVISTLSIVTDGVESIVETDFLPVLFLSMVKPDLPRATKDKREEEKINSIGMN